MSTTSKFTRPLLVERVRRRLQDGVAPALDGIGDVIESIEEIIAEVVADLVAEAQHEHPASVSLLRGGIQRREDDRTMSSILQDDQKAPYSLVEKDDEGNATPFQGSAAWSVDDSGVLALGDIADDTSSASVAATGQLGTGTLTIVVTLPDESTTTITEDITVEVSAPVSVAVLQGTPEHV